MLNGKSHKCNDMFGVRLLSIYSIPVTKRYSISTKFSNSHQTIDINVIIVQLLLMFNFTVCIGRLVNTSSPQFTKLHFVSIFLKCSFMYFA